MDSAEIFRRQRSGWTGSRAGSLENQGRKTPHRNVWPLRCGGFDSEPKRPKIEKQTHPAHINFERKRIDFVIV